MAIDPQHVGSLYRKLGMDTSPELIARRIEVLKPLLDSISKADCLRLTAVVFERPIPIEDIDWLLKPLRESEPGFASNGVDPEVELVAAVILRDLIGRTGDFTRWLSLAVETASFGGLRPLRADPTLVDYAHTRLVVSQIDHASLKSATYRKKIDFSEDFKPVEANIQWPQAHAVVKQTIQQVVDYTSAGLNDQAVQLQNVIETVRRLDAQQQIQWWAVAGWSGSADCPFQDLRAMDAANRAAIELAGLSSQIPGGPHSAPGMLYMAISRGRQSDDIAQCVLCDAVTSSPMAWRKTWGQSLPNHLASLFPIRAAAHLSIEASDEPDWKAQFQRKVGVDPSLGMTPVKYATQLFRECIVSSGVN